MSFLSDYDRLGTPWRVSFDLIGTQADNELVRPTPLRRDQAGIAGDRFHEQNGIVMLGFCYHIVAGGAGVGINLYSKIVGAPTDPLSQTIWRVLTQAAGSISLAVPYCWVPLQPADTRTTPISGASLFLDGIGTLVTGSHFMAWGIHTTHDWGDRGYTGSPVIFPA